MTKISLKGLVLQTFFPFVEAMFGPNMKFLWFLIFIFTCFIFLKYKNKAMVSQSAITCSKLTVKTLKQDVKYVQS